MIIIIIFTPWVLRIPRDLETEKLEIENVSVRSDTWSGQSSSSLLLL